MSMYHYSPSKIHFGSNTLDMLGKLSKKYGKRVMLITPQPIPPLEAALKKVHQLLKEESLEVCVFDQVQPNPLTSDIDQAVRLAKEFKAEVVVAFGGGSTIDTAKIVAYCARMESYSWQKDFFENPVGVHEERGYFKDALPLIAVTTTSGTGSQVTQASVVTDVKSHRKVTLMRQQFFSKEVIVDPNLMLSLPYKLTASTAFDAFSHLCESYINGRLSFVTAPLALIGIQNIVDTLPKIKEDNDIKYREILAASDTLGGICLSNGGGNLPHFLGELLTSYIPEINHGMSLAMVYPEFVKAFYGTPMFENRLKEVLDILNIDNLPLNNGEDAAEVVNHYLSKIDLNMKVADFNPTAEQLDNIVTAAGKNPRVSNPEAIKELMKCVVNK